MLVWLCVMFVLSCCLAVLCALFTMCFVSVLYVHVVALGVVVWLNILCVFVGVYAFYFTLSLLVCVVVCSSGLFGYCGCCLLLCV